MARDIRSGRARPGRRLLRLAGRLALLAGMATCARAGEAEPARQAEARQITWAVYDAAPYMFTDGREAGISDRVRRLLVERLDDYVHRTLVVPFPRVVSSMKQGAEWCFVGGVRTPERDAFAYFSRPTGMFYPLRIMIRASQQARFAALGPLSLRGLLAEHPALRTSVLRDRALSPSVDALLREAPALRMHSDFTEGFRMLRHDRLDYLIEYANIAAYYARALEEPAPWIGLPMDEAPEPVFSRVMCSRTPWGRAVIDRIDAILLAERPTERFRGIVEAWAAEADLPKVRAVYESAFLASE